MSKNNVSLAAVLHDPESRIKDEAKKYLDALDKLYGGNIAISVSYKTSLETRKLLTRRKIVWKPLEKENDFVGNNYRQALQLSLQFNKFFVHLVDCDRVLHWVRRFPQELERVISQIPIQKSFLFFNRSKRAFDSHPFTQRSAESTINALASKIAGKTVDIMSGSFGMDLKTARILLRESKRDDFGIYAEFLEILIQKEIPYTAIEIEGLEWETPDQYRDKIKREGYIEWLENFQSFPEWKRRLEIINESSEVLL